MPFAASAIPICIVTFQKIIILRINYGTPPKEVRQDQQTFFRNRIVSRYAYKPLQARRNVKKKCKLQARDEHSGLKQGYRI